MRFLADMGSPNTVSFLGDLGHDAVHLHALGLDRLPDSDILEKAREEQLVLLTHDLDFGELIAASGARLPSTIMFRLRVMRPERVNHHLEGIISQQTEAIVETRREELFSTSVRAGSRTYFFDVKLDRNQWVMLQSTA